MPAIDWSPYVYIDEQGRFRGPLDDFIKRVARKLGLTLRYKAYPGYTEAQPALLEGQIDLLFGVAPEQARHQPKLVTLDIMGVPSGILLPRSRETPTLAVAQSWRWVCVRGLGSCGELARLGVKEIKTVASIDEASFMVKWGLADGYLADLPTLLRMQHVRQDGLLMVATPSWVKDTSIAVMMAEQNTTLQTQLTQILDSIPDSERQRLLEAVGGIDYGLVQEERQSAFNQDELSWLARHQTLKFGVSPHIPGVSELDRKGQLKGFVADLLALISARTGLHFALVPTSSWEETIAQFKAGALDFVPGIIPTAERRQFALFTPEYTFFQRSLIGSKGMAELSSLAELNGLRVGMVSGSAERQMLEALGAEPVFASSYDQLLELLNNHQADYVVIAIPSLTQAVQAGFTERYQISYMGDELKTPIAMATRLQDPILQQILTKALLTISPEDLARLEHKWLPLTIETGLDPARVRFWSAIGSGAFLLCLLLFFGWNRTLRQQISQRLLVEQRLNEQLTFVQTLLDSLPNMVVLRDNLQHITLSNRAYREAFIGDPEPDKVPCLDHISSPAWDRISLEEQEVWRSGKKQEGAIECPCSGCSLHHVIYTKQPYRSLSGEMLGVLTVLTDVTRLKEAEARARQAETRLTQITDSMPGIVYQYQWRGAGTGHFLYLSRGATDMLGLDRVNELPLEPVGKALGFTDDTLQAFIDKVDEHARSLSPLDLEIKIDRPDGDCYLQVRGSFVRQSEDSLVINGVVQDITALKRQAHELREARGHAEQAMQARSRFLATMSHELRTPISGMNGMLELLQLSALNDDQRYLLRNIVTSTNGLLYLVNDILDFSKIEAGQLQLHYHSCQLDSVICDVIRGHATQAHLKGLRVTLEWAAGVPDKACIDSVRVGQVLSNLLSNAVKFTERGSIDISVGYDADHLVFNIKDTGIGIAKEQQELLFTPFRQLESDTTRRYGGSGLGLAICHQLIQKMGGTLALESEPGAGTSMRFSIPLRDCLWDSPPLAEQEWWWFGDDAVLQGAMQRLGARLRPLAPEQWQQATGGQLLAQESWLAQSLGSDWQAQLQQSPLKGIVLSPQEALRGKLGSNAWWRLGQSPLYPDLLLETCRQLAGETVAQQAPHLAAKLQGRVLVADDHPVNRALLARQLALLGLHAEMVADGEEALRAWQEQAFALLLTDCHMPVMDGYSLATTLRAAGEKAPILGITADASEEASTRMLAAGMDDMLFKPYNLEALRQKLIRWLPASGPHLSPKSLAPVNGQQPKQYWMSLFGDEEVARSMAREYLGTNRQDGDEMRRALACQDTRALTEAAHRIKGAARMVGQTELAAQAAKLESASLLQELEKSVRLTQVVQQSMDSITHDIGLWLDEQDVV